MSDKKVGLYYETKLAICLKENYAEEIGVRL